MAYLIFFIALIAILLIAGHITGKIINTEYPDDDSDVRKGRF